MWQLEEGPHQDSVQSTRRSQKIGFAGVAFTAWRNETQPKAWILQIRASSTSYKKLVKTEKMNEIGGQPLTEWELEK